MVGARGACRAWGCAVRAVRPRVGAFPPPPQCSPVAACQPHQVEACTCMCMPSLRLPVYLLPPWFPSLGTRVLPVGGAGCRQRRRVGYPSHFCEQGLRHAQPAAVHHGTLVAVHRWLARSRLGLLRLGAPRSRCRDFLLCVSTRASEGLGLFVAHSLLSLFPRPPANPTHRVRFSLQ